VFKTGPDEIAKICRGVYAEFVELFINDGFASWLGIDISSRDIVEVQRYAGPMLNRAPKISFPSRDYFTRETKT
jgi:hypothetical protein